MDDLLKKWPEIAGLLYVFALIGLWIVVSGFVVGLLGFDGLDEARLTEGWSAFNETLGLCIAAFVGSYFAFFLAKKDKEIKEKNEKIDALNYALFVVSRQINLLADVKKNNLADFYDKHEFERAFNMPVFDIGDVSSMSHDFSSLAFLIKSGSPNLLMKLNIEQERFFQATRAIKLRNEFMLREGFVAIERSGINGVSLSLDSIKGVLGERVYGFGVNSAKDIFVHVDLTFNSLVLIKEELRRVAKRLYPEEVFIDYAIQDFFG